MSKKNFQALLIEIFGKSETTKPFPRRMAKMFIRTITYLCSSFPDIDVKSYESRIFAWNNMWPAILKHYTRKACRNRCPCAILRKIKPHVFAEFVQTRFAASATDSVSSASVLTVDTIDLMELSNDIPSDLQNMRNHIWLDSTDAKHREFIEKLEMKWPKIQKEAEGCLYNANTCLVEASHARRTSLASKKSNYKTTYASRAFLSSWLENDSYFAIGSRLIELKNMPEGLINPRFYTTLTRLDENKNYDRKRRATDDYKMKAQKQRTQKFVDQQLRKQKFQGITDPAYRQKLLDEQLSPTSQSQKKGRTKAQKQIDLKTAFDANPTTHCGVKLCSTCGTYYKSSHKCRVAPIVIAPLDPVSDPPKVSNRSKKRRRSTAISTPIELSTQSRDSDEDQDIQLAIMLSLKEAQVAPTLSGKTNCWRTSTRRWQVLNKNTTALLNLCQFLKMEIVCSTLSALPD